MHTFKGVILLLFVALFPIYSAGGKETVSVEKIYYENREEIPNEYRWNLEDIFPSPQAFEETYSKTTELITMIGNFKGKLNQSAEMLAEALNLKFQILRDYEELQVYSGQYEDIDTRNQVTKDLYTRVNNLSAAIDEALAFIEPEISSMNDKTLQNFMKNKTLKTFNHYLENLLRMKPHIRNGEIEEVLASASLMSSAPQEAYSNMVYADIEWPTITGEDGQPAKIIPALYYTYVASQNRNVRKEAALALFKIYTQYANTFAATYGGHVQRDIFFAKNRLYDRSIDMALDKENVPYSVIEILLNTVHENFPLIHRYAALRKKVLGLDEFHVYDLYVSLVPEGDKKITYEEGKQMAVDFWRDIYGVEYVEVATKAFSERWIDVYASEGKRGGAYSWGSYNSHPYLLLNWGGTMEDVFTLVHEMGHSIHSYMTNKNQPYHYSEYSLFVAEVAAVASEALFLDYTLKKTTDPTERLFLLNMYMNNITGTFLRQIFFNEFELKAHEMAERGESLTKQSLGDAYAKLWKDYYGPELVLDEEFHAGWSRIPHFYRTFYVWVYASSFAAGEAIAERFREGDQSAVKDYLNFLKLGDSVYPMEALKQAGVDITDPTVIRTVMKRYEETLNQMEKLLLTNK